MSKNCPLEGDVTFGVIFDKVTMNSNTISGMLMSLMLVHNFQGKTVTGDRYFWS